jgi:hypothetical protein
MAGPWTSTSRTGVPPRPAGGPAAATAARGCPVVGALQDQERRPAGSDIAERAGAWVPVSRSSSGVDGSRQRQPDIPTERRALRTAQACADAPPAWLPPRFLARGLRQRPRGRRPGRVARAPVTTLAPGARADLRSDRGCGWPGAAGQPGGEAQPGAPRPARHLVPRHPVRSGPSRPISRRWFGPARYGRARGRSSRKGGVRWGIFAPRPVRRTDHPGSGPVQAAGRPSRSPQRRRARPVQRHNGCREM